MLSKAYYEKFAEILGTSSNTEEIVERLIVFFKLDNNNFDESRFRFAIEESSNHRLEQTKRIQ